MWLLSLTDIKAHFHVTLLTTTTSLLLFLLECVLTIFEKKLINVLLYQSQRSHIEVLRGHQKYSTDQNWPMGRHLMRSVLGSLLENTLHMDKVEVEWLIKQNYYIVLYIVLKTFKDAKGVVLANHFQDVRRNYWSPLDLISVNHFETTPIFCRHPHTLTVYSLPLVVAGYGPNAPAPSIFRAS